MRRPDLPLRAAALAALFSASALFLILATAPLSLALSGRGPDAGLSAASVSGTVWRGRLRDAALGGIRLGDVQMGVSPLSLLAARVRLGFRSDSVSGALRLGPGALELLDIDGVLPLAALAPQSGLSGRVGLQGFDLDLRRSACRRAGGEVRLDQIRLAGLELPGLVLTGTAACAGKDLVVPLRGQAEGVDVQADLRATPAGAYAVGLTLRTTRPEVEAALAASGYRRTLEGYATTLTGQLGLN
jgi:general secretion pathway protein N